MSKFSGYAWAMARFVQAILLGTLAFTFLTTDVLAADQRTCKIDKLSGRNVHIHHQGADRAAALGAELARDDTIRTGPASRVELLCSDGVRVTVGCGTRMSLGNLPGDGDETTDIVMRVLSGVAGFIAPERRWRSFRVQGPSAIASVRSTEWLVIADNGGTDVFVRKGTVAVEATNPASSATAELALLSLGEGIDVSANGSSEGVKVWGQGRLRTVFLRLGFAWGV